MIDKKILLLLAYASSKLMARDAARFSIANLKEKSESTYIPSDFFCYYFVSNVKLADFNVVDVTFTLTLPPFRVLRNMH